jgi:hypothetical protein
MLTKHRFIEIDGMDIFYREAGDQANPLLLRPQAELDLLDTGHFALEAECEFIAERIGDFLHRHVRTGARKPDTGRNADGTAIAARAGARSNRTPARGLVKLEELLHAGIRQ